MVVVVVGVRAFVVANNLHPGRTATPPSIAPTEDSCPNLPEIDFFRRFSVIFYTYRVYIVINSYGTNLKKHQEHPRKTGVDAP